MYNRTMELTQRQAAMKARIETYYPHLQIVVDNAGKYVYMIIKNPNRPYAGEVLVGGSWNERTKRENNWASSTTGTNLTRIPLNNVMMLINELAA